MIWRSLAWLSVVKTLRFDFTQLILWIYLSFSRWTPAAPFSRSDTRSSSCAALLGWKALCGELPAHTHPVTPWQDLHPGPEVIILSTGSTFGQYRCLLKVHVTSMLLSCMLYIICFLNTHVFLLLTCTVACSLTQWRAGGFDDTFYRWTDEPGSDQTHPNLGVRDKCNARVWTAAEGAWPWQWEAQERGRSKSSVFIWNGDTHFCEMFIFNQTWLLQSGQLSVVTEEEYMQRIMDKI